MRNYEKGKTYTGVYQGKEVKVYLHVSGDWVDSINCTTIYPKDQVKIK